MLVGIEQLMLSPARLNRSIPQTPVSMIKQIKEHGQLQPVVVRALTNHRYEILANAESWLAVQRAGLHQVDIVIKDDVDDSKAEKLVNRNIELDPIAEAQWFRSQVNPTGQGGQRGTVTQLAHSLGLGRSYVAHALRLLELSDDIQQAVRTGALKVGHAKAILIVKKASARSSLAAQILRLNLSVREAEAAARSMVDAVEKSKPVTTKHLEKSLSEIVGSAIEINQAKGTITIDYCGEIEVLQGIIERLGYRAAARDEFA